MTAAAKFGKCDIMCRLCLLFLFILFFYFPSPVESLAVVYMRLGSGGCPRLDCGTTLKKNVCDRSASISVRERARPRVLYSTDVDNKSQ
uniref:Putative secreted protein n=1 Tax=Ixodes scapularis TaxID=6945 RepID=A0A4D5RZ12_IXOSC